MNLECVRLLSPLERLTYWMCERQRIYESKIAGRPRPWTDDPILNTYRFCNVFREQDAVTVWINDNWRMTHWDDPEIWFAMVVARLFNNPDTLEHIGYVNQNIYNEARDRIWEKLDTMRKSGKRVFNPAYIVSTNGHAMDKVEYLFRMVLDPLSDAEPHLIAQGMTLAQTHGMLRQFNGLGSFMAAQVVADLKNTPLLRDAPDWWDWCAPGPGSMRGMRRVLGERGDAVKKSIPAKQFLEQIKDIREKIYETYWEYAICLQDMQNCLCEFDKYERVLWDEGRPKQHYTPAS